MRDLSVLHFCWQQSLHLFLCRQNYIQLRMVLWISIGEGNGTPLQYSCLENPMDGGTRKAAVHGVAKSQTGQSDFTFTFHFHALEKEMATHSSVLAWRIPGMGKPGGLPSMGSHRVGHNWSDLAAAAAAAWISFHHLFLWIYFFSLFFYYIKINPLRIFNLSTQNREEEGGLVCIFGSGLLRKSQNQLLIQEHRLQISQL